MEYAGSRRCLLYMAAPDGQVHEKYDDAQDFRADDPGERLLSMSI